jgi:hypothetical protein
MMRGDFDPNICRVKVQEVEEAMFEWEGFTKILIPIRLWWFEEYGHGWEQRMDYVRIFVDEAYERVCEEAKKAKPCTQLAMTRYMGSLRNRCDAFCARHFTKNILTDIKEEDESVVNEVGVQMDTWGEEIQMSDDATNLISCVQCHDVWGNVRRRVDVRDVGIQIDVAREGGVGAHSEEGVQVQNEIECSDGCVGNGGVCAWNRKGLQVEDKREIQEAIGIKEHMERTNALACDCSCRYDGDKGGGWRKVVTHLTRRYAGRRPRKWLLKTRSSTCHCRCLVPGGQRGTTGHGAIFPGTQSVPDLGNDVVYLGTD